MLALLLAPLLLLLLPCIGGISAGHGLGPTLLRCSPPPLTSPLLHPFHPREQFFATKTDASALRMLAGSPAERLLKPIADYIVAQGGRIHTRWGCRCEGGASRRSAVRAAAGGTAGERSRGCAALLAEWCAAALRGCMQAQLLLLSA